MYSHRHNAEEACSDTQVSVSSAVLNIPYLWASPGLQYTNQLFPLTGGRGPVNPACHGQTMKEGDWGAGKRKCILLIILVYFSPLNAFYALLIR